ncbi:hypothetical protein ABZ354_02260 [Streptomyces sp. NPDC005925]|uniref:hypothetical protein n=1 Tax=Streptomyces sp. NPDC005925 TaxID=3157172 RepID=UPI0033C739A3
MTNTSPHSVETVMSNSLEPVSDESSDRVVLGRLNIRSHPQKYLHTIEEKIETHRHRTIFDGLIKLLEQWRLDCPYSAEDTDAQEALKDAKHARDSYNIHTYRLDTGEMFALDHQGRWIALFVSSSTSPMATASSVSRAMQQAAEEGLGARETTIDVTLVPPPGLTAQRLEELTVVVHLAMTFRLPNSWLRKRKGQGDLRPLIEKLAQFHGEEGEFAVSGAQVNLPHEVIETLDEGASGGHIGITATASTGESYDSRAHVAQFQSRLLALYGDLTPVVLILAVAWLIEEWVSRGGSA